MRQYSAVLLSKAQIDILIAAAENYTPIVGKLQNAGTRRLAHNNALKELRKERRLMEGGNAE